MLNLEEKNTTTFRDDYEKQDHYSEPIARRDVRTHKSTKDDSNVEKLLLNPWDSYPQRFNKTFLALCVIGVTIDPLFLYVPIIDAEKKCLAVDDKMKYIAFSFRTLTDIPYILGIIFRLRNAQKTAKELGLSVFMGFPWTHHLIDVLTILPLPQESTQMKNMLNPEEKNTATFRDDYDYSEPVTTRCVRIHKSTKDVSTVEKLLNPWGSYPQLLNEIFLASCVIGVAIDPLFLYVPIIDAEKKCLAVDDKMKYIAFSFRTFTDISYILHIIFRLRNAQKTAKELGLSVFMGFPWTHLIIDVLAILPLPQVIILKFFSKLAGSRSLLTRKFLNFLLLVQYIPRLMRVYLSARDLGRGLDSLARRVWVRGAFFFLHYIIFAHIFGALWYFYAIFRETACWHEACKRLPDCELRPFDCRWENPIGNMTYLNQFCPVDPPNSTPSNFGIFANAIESGILQKRDFMRKFCRSFWWGLKNLSSLGQNLETTSNVYENLFAVLISILGLLLFLYLIGNLQTYMQLATTKSEEERRKISIKLPEIDSFLSNHNLPAHKKKVIVQYLRQTIKEDKDFDVKHLLALFEEHSEHGRYNGESFSSWVTKILDVKRHDRNTSELKAELWIEKSGIKADMKAKIMRYVRLRLIEGKDVDIGNLLPILPTELGSSVKKFLCFPILKKVLMLKNMDDFVYETICSYVKPAIYAEKSYIIRKEEPVDFMLFVTQGVLWSFGSGTKRLQKGDFFGEELLEWRLNSTSYAEFPISKSNLKCHTKVEAFALMAVDLEHVLSKCWTKFTNPNEPMSEGLKLFAAASLQQGFRRFIRNKKAKDNNANQLSIVTYK